jgi:acyl dehydratase
MTPTAIPGSEIDVVRFPVERGKVREFTRALFDNDPIYRDDAAAEEAGFDAIPAPLTYSVVAMHWRDGDDAKLLARKLGLDLRRILHGEAAWEYLAPVHVGDELTARRRVADVTTREGKRGGSMTLIEVESEFTNQHGELVLRQRDTIIEKGA